ncbi:hypothetical protein [Algoriphagus namhaensis]
MATRVFKETQTYRGTWVAYFILLVELPTLALLIFLFFNTDDKGQIGTALALVVAVLGIILLLVFSLKLETRIDDHGVSFRYFPFIPNWRKYTADQIQNIQVINYSPITDYGGWGIKGNKTTKAYSILGDEGILIDVGEKKKIMIGTLKAKQLRAFLENWREDHYGS